MRAPQTIDLDANHCVEEPNLESVFRLHYARIAKLIARITRDPGGAEEQAVEVFLRWPPSDRNSDAAIRGWLTKIAVRLALDEIRRRNRRGRLVQLAAKLGIQPTPEDMLIVQDQRQRVMRILANLKHRDAELLTLRTEWMSYEELASALTIKPTSIGKLIERAQDAFRKEYIKRYGKTS